jgi:hypothetical protein
VAAVLAYTILVAAAGGGCAPRMTPGKIDLPGGRAVVPFEERARGYPVLTVTLPRGDRQAALDLTQPFGSISYQAVGRKASGALLDFLRFPAVRLGDAVLRDPSFLLDDVPEADLSWRMPAVLGVRLFQDILLTIDGPNRQLVLERGSLPPPDGAEVLPLRTDVMGRPSVQVTVGSRRVWLRLSTGMAPAMLVPEKRKSMFPGTERTIRQDQLSLTAGPFYQYLARLDDDVVIGRHVLTRPMVHLSNVDEPALGWAYLRHFAVTIDQKNKRVRFARAAGDPIRHRMLVPGFQIESATLTVTNVFPGSGAERAGMRTGDRIVSIGGVPLTRVYPINPEFPPAAGGDAVWVVLEREGQQMRLLVPVEEPLL